MEINADFTRRAAIHSATLAWTPSPTPGVDRRMLDRIGGEVARATSIVRYHPGSAFPRHVHGGGEEFLVLDGVFSDEHGDMPVGSYVRNPPGTSHAPGSAPGCVIFVKLWQFDPGDDHHVRVQADALTLTPDADHAGVSAAVLHQDARERVRLEQWAPDAQLDIALPGGGEILVLAGAFAEDGEAFSVHDWLRLPAESRLLARAGQKGCRVWIKTGHLLSKITAP